jgi:hypothetical protein
MTGSGPTRRACSSALVLLGRHAQLGRHLVQHLYDHKCAGVGLQISEEAPDIAPGLGQPGAGVQRRPGVA